MKPLDYKRFKAWRAISSRQSTLQFYGALALSFSIDSSKEHRRYSCGLGRMLPATVCFLLRITTLSCSERKGGESKAGLETKLFIKMGTSFCSGVWSGCRFLRLRLEFLGRDGQIILVCSRWSRGLKIIFHSPGEYLP